MINNIFLGMGCVQVTSVQASMSVANLVAGVVQDFWKSVFMNPEKHMMAIMVMGVVVIGACVGLAFLTKKVYEKFCPEHPAA